MFFIASAASLVVFAVSLVLVPAFAVVLGALALFAVYLTLIALTLPALDARFLRAKAAEADAPVVAIFVSVLAVVGACCITLFMALNGRGAPAAIEVALSIVSVLLGWFTIHTMTAMHYAYEYYEPAPPGSEGSGKPSRGLSFPDDDEPDAFEFLYFAYVIGTAFAVSDVQVQSRKMRKFVLLHSTFAYFFNTLIVAATVNVAVAVGS